MRHREPHCPARPSGFTLIELLIVLGILALLVGVVIPAVARFLSRGRDEAAEVDRRTIEAAVSAYYLDPANRQQFPTQDGTAGPLGTTSTTIDIALLTTANYLRDVPDTASTLNHDSGEGNLTWYVRADGKVDFLEAVTPNVTVTVDAVSDVGAELGKNIALDASGFPVVSYRDTAGGGCCGDLKVLHCGNANCTSGNSINTPDGGGGVGVSALVLDASGFPVVSYFDAAPATRDLRVLRCGDAVCTGALTAISVPDTGGDVGNFSSITLDASGFPVVSYVDSTNGNLKVLHCGDASCTPGTNSITSPDAGGIDSSLVLDASGFPVVSHRVGPFSDSDLRVVHCGNANCTADNSLAAPDTAGAVGSGTSIALDASGFPVVSYHDGTNGDLKILHCGNANCTAGNSITSPDTAGNVGLGTSLVLDASGFPVVAYTGDFSSPPAIFRVLHCGNANCTAGNSITVHEVGSSPSIALDASGNPVVSYNGTGGLKILHCGNPNC